MQFEIGAQKPPPPPKGLQFDGKHHRILLIVAIVAGLLALVFTGLWFMNRSADNSDKLAAILVAQNEMLRKLDTAYDHAQSANGANFIIDAQSLLKSDTYYLTAYLTGEMNGELSEEAQVAARNTEHDEEISDAAATNNFDAVFMEVLKEDLEDNIVRLEELQGLTKKVELWDLLERTKKNHQALIDNY